MGRLSPNYYTQDGVIPRTKLPQTLRAVNEIAARHGLQVGNVFHAGDGNLHPAILFDARDPQQFARVVAASNEMMKLCIEMGGSITGEHGVGLEKRDLMPLLFSDDDLDAMGKVKNVFNPAGRLNPGKLLPLTKSCGELRMQPLPQKAAL
jgi:glycolate oxidase